MGHATTNQVPATGDLSHPGGRTSATRLKSISDLFPLWMSLCFERGFVTSRRPPFLSAYLGEKMV